jgi:hypothetical protein
MSISLRSELKVADELRIAPALLHRERPDHSDFSIEEIVERVQREELHGSLRPGVYVHVVQHCVASGPPNPGRYRMLYETTEGRRGLVQALRASALYGSGFAALRSQSGSSIRTIAMRSKYSAARCRSTGVRVQCDSGFVHHERRTSTLEARRRDSISGVATWSPVLAGRF